MLPNKPRGIPRVNDRRSRGGLTSKIHALVDSSGLPVRLALTTGEAHGNRLAAKLLSRLKSGSIETRVIRISVIFSYLAVKVANDLPAASVSTNCESEI